jgi:hypothetical protein
MVRIGKIDRAIIEHLIKAEAEGAVSYAVAGQSQWIIIQVSKKLNMGYHGLPMPLRYMHGDKGAEWGYQQKKNHSVAQSIRRSLRKLERDGIITTFQARFTGGLERDRNKSWCLTEAYADTVFGGVDTALSDPET